MTLSTHRANAILSVFALLIGATLISSCSTDPCSGNGDWYFHFRMDAANAVLFASWTANQSGGGSGGCGTSWSTVAPMPTARSDLAAGAVGNIIYALGGQSGTVLGTNEAYDSVANNWSTMASMPVARKDFGVGVVNGIV